MTKDLKIAIAVAMTIVVLVSIFGLAVAFSGITLPGQKNTDSSKISQTDEGKTDATTVAEPTEIDDYLAHPFGYFKKGEDGYNIYYSTRYGFSFSYPNYLEPKARAANILIFIDPQIDSGVSAYFECNISNDYDVSKLHKNLVDQNIFQSTFPTVTETTEGTDSQNRDYTLIQSQLAVGTYVENKFYDYYYKTEDSVLSLGYGEDLRTTVKRDYFEQSLASLQLPPLNCNKQVATLGKKNIDKVARDSEKMMLKARSCIVIPEYNPRGNFSDIKYC